MVPGKHTVIFPVRQNATVRFVPFGLPEGTELYVTNRGGGLHLEWRTPYATERPAYPFVSEVVTFLPHQRVALFPFGREGAKPLYAEISDGVLHVSGKGVTTLEALTID